MNLFTIAAVVLQVTVFAVPVELSRSTRFGTSAWRSAASKHNDKIVMRRLLRSFNPHRAQPKKKRMATFLRGNPISGYRVHYTKH